MFPKLATFLILSGLATGAHALDIQRWQTPNGSQVLLVERHELPIVDYNVIFKGAGTIAEPDSKSNTASATALLIMRGTEQLDEEQFNAKINDLASSVAGSAGFEYSSFGFRSLSQADTLNATADLFNQALTQPRFDATVLDRIKQQTILSLKQSESYPGYLGDRELTKLNYGTHPYGKSAYQTAEKIQAVEREDLKRFHQNHYTQSQAMITIVGDITKPQAEALIRRTLAGVPTQAKEVQNAPPVTVKGGQHKHIPFPHSTQTTISIGLPVMTAYDPDYFAMMVGNYILGGGGFDSRLMQELRDKRGFTYGASSSVAGYNQLAPFSIEFSTENKNSKEALKATQKVLADFVANGPTEEELKQAKAHLTGSFPLKFDTNGKLLANLISVGFYNRPADWFDTYNDKINALTVTDIQRAWQRKIKPEQMNIVVTGGESPFDNKQ